MLDKLRSRTARVVALGAGIVIVGGSVAYASIPDAGGAVHGCYDKNLGSLRVIDTAKHGLFDKCLPYETAISWSQTGPQGPKGDQGPPISTQVIAT